MPSSKRILVLHLAGQYPMAGIGWQAVHYVLGLVRLGYDAYYVEDSGANPYDPRHAVAATDCAYSVDFLRDTMARVGLEQRWAYWDMGRGDCYGLSRSALEDLYRTADGLLNVCGASALREEHLHIPVRIYVETDPVGIQIKLAQGDLATLGFLDAHTHHATYGENLGDSDCPIPLPKFAWTTTRPPVVLDQWPLGDDRPGAHFTTISTWENDTRGVSFGGQTYYWSKHVTFAQVLDLPRRTTQTFELALDPGRPDAAAELRQRGWRLRSPYDVSCDIDTYREFIRSSRGEFTAAKDLVVRSRSGWFSDRSVCYLAAGRPVVTQDTAFGKRIPTGRGLLAFSDVQEARDAIEAINADYEAHRRAARDIAAEYFASDKVLGQLLTAAGL